MTTFGEFVKNLRIEKSITLRNFCKLADLDPSNWSKIERKKLHPPKSREILERIAKVLDVDVNTENWYVLIDLAIISSIPTELIEDKSVVDKLPIFFRTVRGENPSEEELEKLIKLLKEN